MLPPDFSREVLFTLLEGLMRSFRRKDGEIALAVVLDYSLVNFNAWSCGNTGPLSSEKFFFGANVGDATTPCYFKVDTESDGFYYILQVVTRRMLTGFLAKVLRVIEATKAVLRVAGALTPCAEV